MDFLKKRGKNEVFVTNRAPPYSIEGILMFFYARTWVARSKKQIASFIKFEDGKWEWSGQQNFAQKNARKKAYARLMGAVFRGGANITKVWATKV